MQNKKGKGASSSKAAALVGEGYRGFSRGFQRATPEAESTLSPEYQLALKKLAKKDTTTKLKGLKELKDLFATLTPEQVEPVLASWVPAFLRLADDYDAPVRVATFATLLSLVPVAKKKMAPSLKPMITAWLCAQFDPCKEASNNAQKAFRAAIAERKHGEAIMFCKDELLSRLQENFAHTINTIGGASQVPAILVTEKYERVISSSILALRYMIETISAEDCSKISEQLNGMLNAKFWQFCSSKHTPIRIAAYQLLTTLCSRVPELVEQNLQPLSSIVLGSFSEKESVVHPYMWTCLLTFLKRFPQSWKQVNPRKHVWPRLWTFLRGGTFGSASSSYPSLLPFLSLIPAEEIGTTTDFYKEFFSNLWKGLQSESISTSTSPFLVKAYVECAMFCIGKTNAKQEAEEKEKEEEQEKTPTNSAVTVFILENVIYDALVHYMTEKEPPQTLAKTLANTFMTLERRPPSSPSDALPRFWAKLLELSDKVLKRQDTTVDFELYCTRLSSFLGLLNECKNSPVVTFVEELGKFAVSCTTELSFLLSQTTRTAPTEEIEQKEGPSALLPYLQLLARLSSSFPSTIFTSIFVQKENEETCWKDYLRVWLSTLLVDAHPTDKVWYKHLCYLLDMLRAYSGFLLLNAPEQWKEVWTELLQTVSRDKLPPSAFYPVLHVVLSKLVDETNGEMFRNKQLDVTALSIVISWSKASEEERAVSVAKSDVLQFLIRGGTAQQTTLVSGECQMRLLTELVAFLEDSYERCYSTTVTSKEALIVTHALSAVSAILLACSKTKEEASSSAPSLKANLFSVLFKHRRIVLVDETIGPTTTVKGIVQAASQAWSDVRPLFWNAASLSDLENMAKALALDVLQGSASFSATQLAEAAVELLNLAQTRPDTSDNANFYAKLLSIFAFIHNNDDAWWEQAEEVATKRICLETTGINVPEGLFDSRKWRCRCASNKMLKKENDDHCNAPPQDYTRAFLFVSHLLHLLGSQAFFFGFSENVVPPSSCAQLVVRLLSAAYFHLDGAVVASVRSAALNTAKALLTFLTKHEEEKEGLAHKVLAECVSKTCERSFEKGYNHAVVLLYLLRNVFSATASIDNQLLNRILDAHVLPRSINECLDSDETVFTLQAIFAVTSGLAWQQLSSLRKSLCQMQFKLTAGIINRKLSEDLTTATQLRRTLELLHSIFAENTNSSPTTTKNSDEELAECATYLLRLFSLGGDFPLTSSNYLEEGLRLRIATSKLTVDIARLQPQLLLSASSSSSSSKDLFSFVLSIQNYASAVMKEALLKKDEEVPLLSFLCELEYWALLLLSQLKQHQQEGTSNNDEEKEKEETDSSWNDFYSATLSNILALFTSTEELRTSNGRFFPDSLLQCIHDTIRDAPSSLLCSWTGLQQSTQQLYTLLQYDELCVQKTAYRLLLHSLMIEEKGEQNGGQRAAAQEEAEEEHLVAGRTERAASSSCPIPEPLRLIIENPPPSFVEREEEKNVNHHRRVAYFLGWSLLLDRLLIKGSAYCSEVGAYLRSTKNISYAMGTLFEHIDLLTTRPSFSGDPFHWKIATDFNNTKSDSFTQYASHLYLRILQTLPVLVRLWWTDECDRNASALVDKFTTKNFSPLLIENELATVSNYTSEDENFSVRGSKVTREVTATYEKDDMSMTIVIRLPLSYPLRTVEIDCVKRLGISEALWRKWMLSMTTLFITQVSLLIFLSFEVNF
ncbi:listerin E3 ubiquitin protein ligase 1, variant 2 [Balamuthia mandrillaris]